MTSTLNLKSDNINNMFSGSNENLKKIKIFTSYTAVLTKNRKEWEIEHQLVIENKRCENKNKNKKFEFELVLYLYRWVN
jgi:hypothetical protein